MFMNAISRASTFTRPINTIMRTYGGKQVVPGSGTLFFVNRDGWAVTCKHIAEMIANADGINQHYQRFRQDVQRLPHDNKQQAALKGLEIKYKYQAGSIIQLKNNFVDCVDSMTSLTWHMHPSLDLALLHFDGFRQIHYTDVAKFSRNPDAARQGKFLCRLGYAFPEFNNFIYNKDKDDIEWTNTGIQHSPQFPIEGMVTRFLGENGQIYGIEMSTPGLRGQSGGPLFDERGVVYGMQFSTKHLHLGFDLVDKEIQVNNQPKKISDYSFLHLGQCIHAEAIKAFLRQHQVAFEEES